MTATSSTDEKKPLLRCELCGDDSMIILQGRCHITAPLQATLEGDVLTLRCYIPECARVIARVRISEIIQK